MKRGRHGNGSPEGHAWGGLTSGQGLLTHLLLARLQDVPGGSGQDSQLIRGGQLHHVHVAASSLVSWDEADFALLEDVVDNGCRVHLVRHAQEDGDPPGPLVLRMSEYLRERGNFWNECSSSIPQPPPPVPVPASQAHDTPPLWLLHASTELHPHSHSNLVLSPGFAPGLTMLWCYVRVKVCYGVCVGGEHVVPGMELRPLRAQP